MGRFEWNKYRNVGKSVYFNMGTENSVWGCYYREKSVTRHRVLVCDWSLQSCIAITDSN